MDSKFDWQNCWYPVVFTQDLPNDKPYAFDLYDQSLVLFYDAEDKLNCLRNRCPHRAARLSDGQIIDGKLECLYHGWQFSALGECVRIPQLQTDKRIPVTASVRSYAVAVRQRMVWVWAGLEEQADYATIPEIAALDDEDVFSVDYLIDLPYDQTYLIENIIDVAHIHIAHDGLRGGGNRDMALPIDFKVLDTSIKGIKSQYRSIGLESNNENSPVNSANVEFVAPNLIHYVTDYRNKQRIAGLALYSIPLAQGRCRLLYRKYSNFYSRKERLRPRWCEHLIQNAILQQDMALIIGQYSEVNRSRKNLKDIWLPVKTSDTLVLRYRRWLDEHASDAPTYRGYASFKHARPGGADEADDGEDTQNWSTQRPDSDVYTLHTSKCSSCRSIYGMSVKLRNVLLALIAILLPLMLVLSGSRWIGLIVVAYFLSLLLLFATHKLKQQFE